MFVFSVYINDRLISRAEKLFAIEICGRRSRTQMAAGPGQQCRSAALVRMLWLHTGCLGSHELVGLYQILRPEKLRMK